MIEGQLLRVLAYIWMVFGAYWAVFSLVRTRSDSGRSQHSRRFRIALLALSFAVLFVERHAIPPTLLIVLGLIWAGLALKWATPAKAEQSGEFRFYRVLRLVVLATTFALLFWDQTAIGILGRRFAPVFPVLPVIGFALALTGLAVALWARIHLGQYWSDKVVLKVDHQLIRSGPYAHMRHPIYSGVLLGVLGTALVLGEWRGLLAFALLLTNYSIKAKKEERILAARFTDEFRAHQRHAGFLLPRLHAKL